MIRQNVFSSGKMTLYKPYKNPSAFKSVTEYNQNKKSCFKISHMFTKIEVNGGSLIRFHTTKAETHLSKDIVIKNISYSNQTIIKNSNPFFYMDNNSINSYTTISYRTWEFPKTFHENDINMVKLELKDNLISGYMGFLRDNKTLPEFKNNTRRHELITFSANKSEYVIPFLDIISINKEACYNKLPNELLINAGKVTLPYQLSKIYISKERIDISNLSAVTERILNNSRYLEDEIISNWIW